MNNLIALNKLEAKAFFIPSYQRGYRWNAEVEVKELLEDLYEFFDSNQNNDNFYCVQPIVVKKDNTSYRVLDGQQRLTTFFIIYKVLFGKSLFNIEYETRTLSDKFLSEIELQTESNIDNIDFYHFYTAYQYIKMFFVDKHKVLLFNQFFLNKAKIIWYEIDDYEDEIEVFLRLNIGKIPLTNAELIKALFLSSSAELDSDDLRDRAKTWYECEIATRKQNDKVYLLYNNPNNADIIEVYCPDRKYVLNDDLSRIEMYFRLLSGKNNSSQEPQAIFKYYYHMMKNNSSEELWNKFEKCKDILINIGNPKDNEDRILYHYIGFLIESKTIKFELCNLWDVVGIDKSLLIVLLEEKIKTLFNNIILEELSYSNLAERKKLLDILLLFNLVDLNKRISQQKDFEFNRYKLHDWSLEHIIPQSVVRKDINIQSFLTEWLNDLEQVVDSKKVLEQITSLKNTEIGGRALDNFEKLLATEAYLHHIENLVLLDKNSNSKLSNNTFRQKRCIVKDLYNSELLIPQCTEHVFDKKYSNDKSNPEKWTIHDRKMYLKVIKDVLGDFINGV